MFTQISLNLSLTQLDVCQSSKFLMFQATLLSPYLELLRIAGLLSPDVLLLLEILYYMHIAQSFFSFFSILLLVFSLPHHCGLALVIYIYIYIYMIITVPLI